MAGGIGGLVGSIIGGVVTGGAGPAIGAGIGAAIPSVADIARVLVERTVPDPAKREEMQATIEAGLTARETALVTAMQAEGEAQNAINLAEAQGNDRYSSRWRPTLGWALVAAFIYQFLIVPPLGWLCLIAGAIGGFAAPMPPALATGEFMPVLIAMLELSASRSYERTRGVPGAMPGGTKR